MNERFQRKRHVVLNKLCNVTTSTVIHDYCMIAYDLSAMVPPLSPWTVWWEVFWQTETHNLIWARWVDNDNLSLGRNGYLWISNTQSTCNLFVVPLYVQQLKCRLPLDQAFSRGESRHFEKFKAKGCASCGENRTKYRVDGQKLQHYRCLADQIRPDKVWKCGWMNEGRIAQPCIDARKW